MSEATTIEWTDATWNPVRGCSKISPGCKHCYAQTFAERFRGVPRHPYEQGFDFRLVPEKLNEPLRWARSRRIFVNSMSDLFQKPVPATFIDSVFSVMKRADWHIYQVLTKRAGRMRQLVSARGYGVEALEHIWLGVSVEDKRFGLPRIAELQATPAAVRFLSIEPLLEDIGKLDLRDIHWVIVGGESGAGARPLEPEWVRSVMVQCREQKVPFFFKQWGGVRKSRHGRLLDGETYDEFPEMEPKPAPGYRVRRELQVVYGA